MVPIVEPDARQRGQAKISLAHAKGSTTPVYAGAIQGGVEIAGSTAFRMRGSAGFGANSRVHAVGDGAPWIVGQVEAQFGAQGSYLIDFYHVCEYLSDAAKAIAPEPAAQKAWMEAQKDALKTGRFVMGSYRRSLAISEAAEVDDDQSSVRRCHRYLIGRRNQLERYREALAGSMICRSAPERSKARIATSRNYA